MSRILVAVRPRTISALAAAWLGAAALIGGGAASAGTSWTTYHGNAARTGVDDSEPNLASLRTAWANNLDGAKEYGQPVVADGRVFVATEQDNVYALDASNGRVLWSHNIGAPLQNVNANTGCGNIDPLGITSTPVIDLARSTVYVVAETTANGAPPVSFRLEGFDLATGALRLSANATPALPAGESPVHLQQRAALAVGNGRVYVSYGGLIGDCGQYHGWVVGVNESGVGANVQFNTTPNSNGGAIWGSGGGPSIDSSGNLYVVTGNPNDGSTAAYSESVVKLTANLVPVASFQDKSASGDADLGTGDAVLLPNGNLFAIGKTDIGYVLKQSNLQEVAAIPVNGCGDPDGGPAYDAANNTIYVPCRDAGYIQPVNLTTLKAENPIGSVKGAPILVDGNLWAVDYDSSILQEINPTGGQVVQQLQLPSVPAFASPSAADGLLLIGTKSGVIAMVGAAEHPTAGYWLAASDGGLFSFGLAPYHGSLGSHPLNAPIVGMAATPTGRGYWMVASDGGVFSFGDARFYGSTGNIHLNQPIVGMAAARGGNGYWLVARDGGIFTFGPGAHFYGSTGGIRLNQPVVGMAADPATGGYWMVASDGGVFSFHAPFLGSTGGIRLNQPVVGMASTKSGAGYWLVARDGGIFTFGPAAKFYGSTGGITLAQPIVGMAADYATGGYWLVASDGGVFAFHAPFEGSTGNVPLARPIVAMAEP
jgi:outer membrane protein assembly factor BamB